MAPMCFLWNNPWWVCRYVCLTHWGRTTHICVGKLTNIGSDNGSLPGRRQAIIWTSAGILLIGTLGTNFSEILIDIHTFSFTKIHLKVSSAKRRTFCLGLNVIMGHSVDDGAKWEDPAISNRSHLGIYVRNPWTVIHISHGFASKLHILHKNNNIPHWVIAYRRCDKPDDVKFMKIEKNVLHCLMPG